MSMNRCNVKQFESRNFQVVEVKDNVILLECCDYMLIINAIDDTHLRFTISSGDACVAIDINTNKAGFYYVIEQNSICDKIKIESVDDQRELKIKTIDYKCSLIREDSVVKFVAETGEQVELHV